MDANFATFIERIDHIFVQEDADLDASTAAWKVAHRADAATYAPLKPLCVSASPYRNKWGGPSATAILQRCLELGGELSVLATAFLAERPREVWREVGERVPLKNAVLLASWSDGATTRIAFGDGRTRFDVFDAQDFSLVASLKLDAHARCLVGPDRVRALLKDGRAIEQRLGDKKPTVIAELGEVEGGAIDGRHVVAIRSVAEEDASREVVLIDGLERTLGDATPSLAGSPGIIGDVIYVPISEVPGDETRGGGFARLEGERVNLAWLPRIPSGGSAPAAAEHAHEFVAFEGTTFVITWADRAPSARRWIRADDLVEDSRFGADFDRVQTHGRTAWSGSGDRMDGSRSTPIAFRTTCVSAVPLDEDHVVCSIIDEKDKVWLARFRRHGR